MNETDYIDRLFEVIERRGMTIQRFAQLVGVTHSALSQAKSRKFTLSSDTTIRILSLLDTSEVDYIIRNSGPLAPVDFQNISADSLADNDPRWTVIWRERFENERRINDEKERQIVLLQTIIKQMSAV